MFFSIFSPRLPPTPAIPTSHPQSYPRLALLMGPLYMFLDKSSPFSPHYPFPPPLWLLSVFLTFNVSGYILLASLFC